MPYREPPPWQVSSRSWRGHYLENEDRLLEVPSVGLFGILDGEGHQGHAADVVAASVSAHFDPLLLGSNDLQLVETRLRDVVVRANLRACEASRTERYRGCGTTLTCCVTLPSGLVVAHVGNSRLYVMDSGSWRLVTTDHNLKNDRATSDPTGELAEDDLLEMHLSVVTRVLGLVLTVKVDTLVAPYASAPLLFLTDGAWRPFDPKAEGLAPPPLLGDELLDWLHEHFNADGERDNATAMVVEPR